MASSGANMEDLETGFLEFKERVAKVYSHSNKNGQNLDWLFPTKALIGKLEKRTVDLSIYRVPSKIRKLKEEAYSPRVVSIGPFHQSKHDLLAMEEYKCRYVLSLLKRTKNSESCLDECGRAVKELEARARGSYAETFNFDSRQFSEIMLVDGCFILELFLRHSLNDVVDDADPILYNAWMKPTLRYDLALLENQIPFFILERLFKIVVKWMTTHSPLLIIKLALSFFLPELKDLGQEVTKEKYINGTAHLLDLLHIFYRPKSRRRDPSKQGKETLGFKNCATNLLEAGFEFGPGSEEDRLLDIKFNKGVIKIPTLCIQETTTSLLMNLIAFEQCSLGSTHYVTSYAVLMKSLIHSPHDAELLEGKGIIKKDLGVVEDTLSLFSSILNEVVLKDFYFGKVCDKVNEYSKSWWHWQRLKAFWKVRRQRYGAALRNDYFSNPWRIIGFVTALLLLLLTGLQTFYTVRAYYPR